MNEQALRGESIICMSWLNWDWLPLVPHQMMTRLARENRVLYVDPAVALSTFLAHPGQSPHLAGKLKRWIAGPRQVAANLHVYYPPPLVMTAGHLKANDALNRRWLAAAIKSAAHGLSMREPILWIYDPYAVEPRGQFGEKLVIYDCNDDTSSFASLGYKRRNMQAVDAALARRADLLLVTSGALYRSKRELNANIHHLPSGVDFALFNQAAGRNLAVPEELRDVSSPVVGYVGALTNYRIEWEWLETLAQRLAGVTLVLVGPPVEPPPRSVTRLPNVRLVGAKPAAQLPHYLQLFDVGIIPYKGEAFLQSCQPTKTFEYLAAGLGVVSAPIPELQPHRDFVRFASNAEAFVGEVRAMLETSRQPAFRARCIEAARAQTWDARVAAASALARAALERKANGRQPG